MDEFIGEIFMFAGSYAIYNTALCNGALIPIQQNTALFSILGTTYGGNGTTTFALPDLRGKAMIHPGRFPGSASDYALGESGGEPTVTLNVNQIPYHSHTVKSSVFTAGTATTASAIGTAPGSTASVNLYSDTPDGTAAMVPMQMQVDSVTAFNGGSQPHENMQPYLAVNLLISLYGVFPART